MKGKCLLFLLLIVTAPAFPELPDDLIIMPEDVYIETAKAAIKRGYRWAEMSWILENNEMMNRSIQMLGGKVYKTYRMFEKKT